MSEETILRPEQNYGPGNVLRAKREEYEWSVDAVAEALHLSTTSVKAIEADRYEDLPGATYVMGYWRSYARLLGIDIEDTIEANKQNLNIVTAEASGMDVNRAFKHRRRSGSGGWLLFLVVAGVFAYFAWQPPQLFGLLEKFGTSEQVEAGAPQPTEETELDSAPVEEAAKPTEKEQVLRAVEKPAATEDQSKTVVTTTDSTNLLSSQAVIAEQDSGLVMQQAPDTATQADLEPKAVIEPVTTKVMSDEQTPNLLQSDAVTPAVVSGSAVLAPAGDADAPAAISAEATVTFTLSKDTWLDVRDQSRKRLFYKTGKAGSDIDVTGTPPFYILIQPPDGATVHYKGKDQPFSPHKNGLYARFKLGDTLESL